MRAEPTTHQIDPACVCGHPLSIHADEECQAVDCPCQIYRPA